MRKIIIIVSFVFATQVSFAQKTFSECRDTLYHHLTNDKTFNPIKGMDDWENCIKGKEMPALSLKTVTGEKIETKDLKGKVIVINLWFTTCYPCILELPALNRLVEEYKDKDVVFLGISTDTKAMLDSDFFPKYKFDFKIIADGKDIVKKLGHTGFPTFYIIDTTGRGRAAWSGGAVDKSAETAVYLKAKPIIDELLKAE
jgi:peroxiredoxin